jgi:threonine/homoserine/homoserine lactone efflux protein
VLGIHDLWLFIAGGILLIVTPGPDMALIAARSTQHGTRAGVAAALGVGVGAFVHIAAAAIGVSAVLMASAWAFTAIKWLGAAYLIYIGIRMIFGSFEAALPAELPARTTTADLSGVFLQGFLCNVLNPKVAVFFLAFLPQFIDAEAPSKVLAFVTLGLMLDVAGTAWNLGVAWVAGRVGALSRLGRFRSWLERIIGALFVAIGVRLALAERP